MNESYLFAVDGINDFIVYNANVFQLSNENVKNKDR